MSPDDKKKMYGDKGGLAQGSTAGFGFKVAGDAKAATEAPKASTEVQHQDAPDQDEAFDKLSSDDEQAQ